MKLSDLQNAARKANPNFTIDFEVMDNGKDVVEEKTLTFYNILRTKESERKRIAKEFEDLTHERDEAERSGTSVVRQLSERIEQALRAVCSSEDTFDELLLLLDESSAEYDIYMDQLLLKYVEVTRVGEAQPSATS